MAKLDGNDMTEIKKYETPTTMEQWIESKKGIIQQALPKGYEVERMIRVVISALRENPNLGKCSPISFISAVMQSIQLGLEPNTILGHAYIIPYWNSKLNCYEAQFQRGYRGLLDMAYRTGIFKEIYAQEVYDGDTFEFMYGTEKWIKHIPSDKPKLDKDGYPIVKYVYAVYKMVNGGMHFVIWTKEKLDKHKERYSPAAKKDKFSAWNVSENSMYKKTVLKDLLNYADISVEFREQLQVDETVKREIAPDMLHTVKPVYEFNPKDLSGMENEDLEGEKKGKKGKDTDDSGKGKAKLVTEEALTQIFVMGKMLQIDEKDLNNKIKIRFKLNNVNEMTEVQANKLFKDLKVEIDKSNKEAEIIDKNMAEEEKKEEKIEQPELT